MVPWNRPPTSSTTVPPRASICAEAGAGNRLALRARPGSAESRRRGRDQVFQLQQLARSMRLRVFGIALWP